VICLWSYAVVLIQQSKRRYIAAKHIIMTIPVWEVLSKKSYFPYKIVRRFKTFDLERRIDKFDENHGLSDLLYTEESSTDAFALINQQN
jgi:hypothetical protein